MPTTLQESAALDAEENATAEWWKTALWALPIGALFTFVVSLVAGIGIMDLITVGFLIVGVYLLRISRGSDQGSDESKFVIRLALCVVYHTALTLLLWTAVDYFFYELTVDDVFYQPTRFWKTAWIMAIFYPVALSIVNTIVYLEPNKLGHIALFGSEVKWLKFNKLKPGFIILGLPLYLNTVFRNVVSQKVVKQIGKEKDKELKPFVVTTKLGNTTWHTTFTYCCIDPERYFQVEDKENIGTLFVGFVAKGIRDLFRHAAYPDINALIADKDIAADSVEESLQPLFFDEGFKLLNVVNSNVEPPAAVTAALEADQAHEISERIDVRNVRTLRTEAKKMADESNGTLTYAAALKLVQGETTADVIQIDNSGTGPGAVPFLPLNNPPTSKP